MYGIREEECSKLGFVFLKFHVFLYSIVPSLMTRNLGSVVGHILRIMCGNDENYRGLHNWCVDASKF
jgi:hypothetical protein